MWQRPHVSATLKRETFESAVLAFVTAWLPWQSWQSGAFGFPRAIAWPWAESK
jgi:hypothetical protein